MLAVGGSPVDVVHTCPDGTLLRCTNARKLPHMVYIFIYFTLTVCLDLKCAVDRGLTPPRGAGVFPNASPVVPPTEPAREASAHATQ